MRVCFETFGCRLNRAEALQMEAEYLARGWELTEDHAEADLFVVRGCSVTQRAQHDSERLVAHLRHHHPNVPVRVCGCLKRDSAAARPQADIGHEAPQGAPSPLPVRTARAYLKCQDGCSGKCTFCIVPKFRGASVSIPFDSLADRARRFIDAGYREIVLTGCNLALYASGGRRLPELVAALAEVSPDCRIRIGSLEPGDCALATVDAMAEHANVCRFLHVPVQSGANRMLTAMRRPYLVKDVEALAERAVEKMPLIGLGCDLMTGFPGESDIDFMATKGLVKRLAFSNAHVFPYSERPGTPAATLPGALPRAIRHARAHALSDLARSYRAKAAQRFVGRAVEVVVEDERRLRGWTGEYFACEVTNHGNAPIRRKALVRALVRDVDGDVLKALAV